jgi:hypothetical protein
MEMDSEGGVPEACLFKIENGMDYNYAMSYELELIDILPPSPGPIRAFSPNLIIILLFPPPTPRHKPREQHPVFIRI